MRSYTMGKKIEAAKSMMKPGPEAYNTRGNQFFTRGGPGSTTGQRWKFGTEQRNINQEVMKRAAKLPACTDYDLSPKRKPGISFGAKLLDILKEKKMKEMPGPGKYNP